ncbi:MAG TPA: DUF3558 domain-containing protein [Pseudonocardiaceae bacterium]|nr:DUF3558 domain-containing protein [Pseudonocardiaceae bacterium]
MRRTGAAFALAVLLTGCSAAGTPSPVTGATPTSSATASADPIPPIRDVKNLAATRPCDLLTPAQLAASQIDLPARSRTVVGAPACEWDNKAHTRQISVVVDVGHDVLHNVYAQRQSFAIFEITQVEGQPALRTKDTADGTSCTFAVATAQRQSFTLRFTSLRQGLEEPCGQAKTLAETVMGNLPPLKG